MTNFKCIALSLLASLIPALHAAAPKLPQATIVTKAEFSGGFSTTVYCTAGSLILSPDGMGNVTVFDVTTPLITIHTPVNGVGTMPVTIVAAKFDKTVLDGNVVANTALKVGKEAIVTFKSSIINGDLSKTTGSFTTYGGMVIKCSWKTSGVEKFAESWAEKFDFGTTTISAKQTFNGNTFSAKFVNGSTQKTSLKVGKITYAGTTTYTPANGKITSSALTSKVAGKTAVFTFDPHASGGPTQTIVVTTGGMAEAPITHTTPNAAPSMTTPDGRLVTQNQPL